MRDTILYKDKAVKGMYKSTKIKLARNWCINAESLINKGILKGRQRFKSSQ
jgi:hypothetical protein